MQSVLPDSKYNNKQMCLLRVEGNHMVVPASVTAQYRSTENKGLPFRKGVVVPYQLVTSVGDVVIIKHITPTMPESAPEEFESTEV